MIHIYVVVPVVRNLPAHTGDIRDVSSFPGLERSPGGGNDNTLQYSWQEGPHRQRSLEGYVHRVAKSWTRLKCLSMYANSNVCITRSWYKYAETITAYLLPNNWRPWVWNSGKYRKQTYKDEKLAREVSVFLGGPGQYQDKMVIRLLLEASKITLEAKEWKRNRPTWTGEGNNAWEQEDVRDKFLIS